MNLEVEEKKLTHKFLHQFAPIFQSNQRFGIPAKEIQ